MLDAVFNLTRDGLAVLDPDGRVIRTNTAFAELGGLAVDGVVGGMVHEVMTLPDLGVLDHREIRTNRPDVEKWACVSSCRIGSSSLTLVTATDSTPLRMADQILARHDAELRSRNEKLYSAVRHDSLTGLPNRVYLMNHLQHAIGEIAIHGKRLAVVFIDLDGFKPVNDHYGHDVGDEVLKTVSKRFLTVMRGSDLVARLGGDEFVIVGSGVHDAAAAKIVAEKLLAALAAPLINNGRDIFLGASIGITLCSDATAAAEDLLRMADEAMYEAKNAGKNGFRFSPSLEQ